MFTKNLYLLLLVLPLRVTGQYCSGGPSSTIDSNVLSVILNGQSLSINHTGCPGVTGVEDLTAQMADLMVGGNYLLTVQFGTCGNNYAGAGEVWIDWNQNQVFESTESVGTWQGVPPVTASSFLITVPVNAVPGLTRMRVTQQEAGSLPLDPCASFNWGSVMDFSILVTTGSLPSYNNPGGVISSCQGLFFDSGGSTGNYADNENITTTICADTTASCMQVSFSQFNIESNYDYLYIYDGSGTNFPLIGTYTGTNSPGVVTASDACLTFNFISDNSINTTGWSASVSCYGCLPVQCPPGSIGDSIYNPIVAPSLPYSDTGKTTCFTDVHNSYASPDVYYKFTTGPQATSIDISLCGSDFDTYLTLLDANGNALTANDDDASCAQGVSAILSYPVQGGSDYYVVIEGWGTENGTYILNISELPLNGIETNALNQLHIYPVPAKDRLFIDRPMPDPYRVSLYDVQGRNVYAGNWKRGKSTIDLKPIAPGCYSVVIYDRFNNRINKKLIIQN